MILESIVTTMDNDGRVNIAPMGPMVDAQSMRTETPTFILRPWDGSRTCVNLLATGRAVVHVTDDALLMVRAAIGNVPADGLTISVDNAVDESGNECGPFERLADCHRWFAVTTNPLVEPLPDRMPGRHELAGVTVASGVVRPFWGFNRAKHAVIEAAILATRVTQLGRDSVERSLEPLDRAIAKTGGDEERAAMVLIRKHLAEAAS